MVRCRLLGEGVARARWRGTITIDAVDRVLGGPGDGRIRGPDPPHGQGTLPRRTGAREHMMSKIATVSVVNVNGTSPLRRLRGDGRGMSPVGAVVAREDMQSPVDLGTGTANVNASGSATVIGNATANNVSLLFL